MTAAKATQPWVLPRNTAYPALFSFTLLTLAQTIHFEMSRYPSVCQLDEESYRLL
jgi:hypothetical protein